MALTPADERHLVAAIEVARQAREHGNHPFGSILVAASGEVLHTAENTVVTEHDCTNHAELNLVRSVSGRIEPDILRDSTLYASTEPCAMCAGAIFWSGIGRVVYALGTESLAAIVDDRTGDSNLGLSCREVFLRGGRTVEVSGPHLDEQAAAVHVGFWARPGERSWLRPTPGPG